MLKLKVIEIKQPFGVFYVAKINAFDLLKIVEADPYRVENDGKFIGVQRPENKVRVLEIANYLKGVESAMPNSIIIAGNTHIKDDNEKKWAIHFEDNNHYLLIPTTNINGTIIDGQHRLMGFKFIPIENQKNYELLCSIYLDIPNPYQAYLFATININQKSVNKSLAYELYGYNLDEENPDSWSTEKLAVSLTRKLNFDKDSIFYNHIIVAAENDEVLFEVKPKNQDWFLSTASVVDGILTLISSNSKSDRDKLQITSLENRKRNILSKDSSPLRDYYLNNNDKLIYTIINNFFTASFNSLYKNGSYLYKTVGIQAQFKILKTILENHLDDDKDISINYFSNFLNPCNTIDFSDNFFTASGIGKSRIINSILIKLNFKSINEIKKENDKENYERLLGI